MNTLIHRLSSKMPGKIYFSLLILCGVWSQGITGTFGIQEIGESSDTLVRQKRVINRIPGEDETVPISRVPYIVIIKSNSRVICAGSILSNHVVITIIQCVPQNASKYIIVSGASRSDRGTTHTVVDIKRQHDIRPHNFEAGIALLTVHPPIEYGPNCYRISLHSEPLLPGTLGTISGWGHNNNMGVDMGTRYPRSLRSIQVPILAHRDCVNRYRPDIEITDRDICTYHPQKNCGHIDGGAPLVVNNKLVGVHLWTGIHGVQNDPEYPDVFAILQHSAHIQWIRANM